MLFNRLAIHLIIDVSQVLLHVILIQMSKVVLFFIPIFIIFKNSFFELDFLYLEKIYYQNTS